MKQPCFQETTVVCQRKFVFMITMCMRFVLESEYYYYDFESLYSKISKANEFLITSGLLKTFCVPVILYGLALERFL